MYLFVVVVCAKGARHDGGPCDVRGYPFLLKAFVIVGAPKVKSYTTISNLPNTHHRLT